MKSDNTGDDSSFVEQSTDVGDENNLTEENETNEGQTFEANFSDEAEGIVESEEYNIPIYVDTIEKGYPILCA